MNKRGKAIILVIVGLLIGGLLLTWSFRNVALADVIAVLTEQTKLLTFAIALVLYLLFFVVKAYRWAELLVSPTKVPFSQLFSLVLLGYVGSIFVPMQMGETIRSIVLKKRHKIPLASSLSGIGIEKLFDLASIALLMLMAALGSLLLTLDMQQALLMVGFILVAAVCVLWILLRFHRPILHYLDDRHLDTDVTKWRVKLSQAMTEFFSLLTQLRARIVAIVIQSLLMWMLMTASIYYVLISLGLDVSWPVAVLVLFCSALGLMLPTAPGFIGTIQAVFALALLPLGWQPEKVLAAAIAYNAMITLWPMLLAAIAGLFMVKR
ncbi:lysylphosphatidylglycerol synthase transmembrane domain-containing protein [Aliiglaciecola litoralis]|uniref:Flippase-like domain-containing protein n=1 Tax=Aliiglaciecola litoralis TaxID=582857 RepID=A0ABN1LHS1_9ALTE